MAHIHIDGIARLGVEVADAALDRKGGLVGLEGGVEVEPLEGTFHAP